MNLNDVTFVESKDCPSHPGQSVLAILQVSGLSISEAANIAGVEVCRLISLINGSAMYSDNEANKLPLIVGKTPEFWINRRNKFFDDILGIETASSEGE